MVTLKVDDLDPPFSSDPLFPVVVRKLAKTTKISKISPGDGAALVMKFRCPAFLERKVEMIYTNPIYGFFKTLLLFATGKVQFVKQDVGKTIIMEDGQDFTIFRRVVIEPYPTKNKKPEGLRVTGVGK